MENFPDWTFVINQKKEILFSNESPLEQTKAMVLRLRTSKFLSGSPTDLLKKIEKGKANKTKKKQNKYEVNHNTKFQNLTKIEDLKIGGDEKVAIEFFETIMSKHDVEVDDDQTPNNQN